MSDKINSAIKFAVDAHNGQVRKITKLPYILHCLEVSAIAASITDDEDIITAALLHDTVEDTPTEIEDIVEKFGNRVAAFVLCDSENKRDNLPKEETWKTRKEESLQVLKNANFEHKIIWISDKLSNMRSMYISWQKEGDMVFNHFHQKDKSMHKWYYGKVLEYTNDLADTFAYQELKRIFDVIFKEDE